jgi:hypothetical protein
VRFAKVTLEGLLSQFAELPADWRDAAARELLDSIEVSVRALRALRRPPTTEDLEAFLRADPGFLDTCRLLLGLGQEPAAHVLSAELGPGSFTWTRLRQLTVRDPARLAGALVRAGLPGVIDESLRRKWRLEDILIERYKMSRGRAIAGQQRGRGLENDIEAALTKAKVPFVSRVTFVGKQGEDCKVRLRRPGEGEPEGCHRGEGVRGDREQAYRFPRRCPQDRPGEGLPHVLLPRHRWPRLAEPRK